MSERARRVGENEAIFREVNEQIEGINRAFAELTKTMDIVCECGDMGCADRIVVSLPEYERVRSDPTLFVLLPGHEAPDVEEVVDRQGGHVVVRKLPGVPEQVARETDPRS